jgi:hypothetical protein
MDARLGVAALPPAALALARPGPQCGKGTRESSGRDHVDLGVHTRNRNRIGYRIYRI